MATPIFDTAAETKFRNSVAEYNKTASPENRHSQEDIEQEVNNRRMAAAVSGASTIPSNTTTDLLKKVDEALPDTAAVASPLLAAPAPASPASKASAAAAGSPFGFDSEEVKKKLLAYGWVPPAAYGAYKLGEKVLPAAQQLWGNLSQKMTGNSNVEAPQIEPILDSAPAQSNMDAMRERLKMNPRPEVQAIQDISENLTPDQIRAQKLKIAADAAQQKMVSSVSGAAPPASIEPAPVSPAQATPAATPSAVDVVTPSVEAAITSDITAAPVKKAQALVHAPEAPVVPVAPTAPSAPAVPATPATPAAAVPPPERTGPLTTASGFPAQEGTGPAKQRIPAEVESMAKIPKGMAFVPGMNLGGTNTARNALGTEGAVALAKQRGVPFGPYDETEQVLKDFNAQRVGPPATRELRKAIGAPMPSNTPALAGKVMKVGGVLGTLMAVSDLANAQSLPEAGSKALEIGSNLLPAPAQAAMFSGNTNAGETEQMAYLRRMQEAKARGAGNRGMAYDPRKPYNQQFMDVGIPPPFTR